MPSLAPSATPARQPQRTCVVCRRKRPQPELLRITGSAAGGWRVTGAGEQRRAGRGTYVCADSPTCWQARRLGRAFRGQAPAVAQQLSNYAGADACAQP